MSTRTTVQPLSHPGPVDAPRIVAVPVTVRVVRRTLAPGRRLVDALDEALSEIGVTSAQVEILGGSFAEVAYCFPSLCEDGSTAVFYSDTHQADGPVQVVSGCATVGLRGGERFVHCHTAWFDRFGELHGGHLWPETVIGDTSLEVVIHALDEVDMVSDTDPETRMPVFTPGAGGSVGTGGETRRAVIARLKPGVDLHDASRRLAAGAGFRTASVRGSLGSLVGAVLARPDGELVLPGPAAEVALTGTVSVTGEQTISAIVIDLTSKVSTGVPVVGAAVVAVTLELLVEEVAP